MSSTSSRRRFENGGIVIDVNVVPAQTRGAARFELCPGVLETRHYATLGVPSMSYGPGLLSVSHGPNEFVSVRKLVQCAEVYALTAMRLLS